MDNVRNCFKIKTISEYSKLLKWFKKFYIWIWNYVYTNILKSLSNYGWNNARTLRKKRKKIE